MMSANFSVLPRGRHKRPLEQILHEQQIAVKYHNSPLKKELIARSRRKQILLSRKGLRSVQRSVAARKALIVHRMRVTKNIKQIKHMLGGLVEAREAQRWLLAPNALLGGTCPVDSIKKGNVSQVVEILARLEEGLHA